MASNPTRNRARASGRRAPATPKHRPTTVDSILPPVQPPPPVHQPPLATLPGEPAGPATPPPPMTDAHGFVPDAYDWVPIPRARRVDGWTPERQRAFIRHLADTGSVARAAMESGMSASSAYRLRQSPEGKGFAAAWESAIQQAAHALVDAAFERAVHGSEEPVFDREGRVIGRRFRQSDAMMMFLLRKHFPDRYGDLHRDRPEPSVSATAPLPPPVAETLARLGPVPPADPAATLDPVARGAALARADAGWLPADLRDEQDNPLCRGLGPEFEEALAWAKSDASARDRPSSSDDRDTLDGWEDWITFEDHDTP